MNAGHNGVFQLSQRRVRAHGSDQNIGVMASGDNDSVTHEVFKWWKPKFIVFDI